MTDLLNTIAQARQALDTKQVSATELTQAFLNHIDKSQPTLNSLISINAEHALAQAAQADQLISSGQSNYLLGIPLIHKDNILVKDLPATAGSHMLGNYVAQYSATIADRFDQAGAITLAKANLDAFAHGSSTENSDYGPSRNPWHIEYVPGGSSGGSAVSVAANQALIATGTDTGGSIRLPASYTNTVGLKPTYGRVSRYGIVAMGSSFDSIGCFTRTVEDCAVVLQVMAGLDPRDSTTSPQVVPDYSANLNQPIKGLKLGIVKQFEQQGVDSQVQQAIDQAKQVYQQLGVQLVEVDLHSVDSALAAYYILTSSEISSNLARFDGIRYGHSSDKATDLLQQYELSRAEGLGSEAKRRIMLGTYALSSGYYDAYYKKAQQARTLIKQDFERVFTQVDGLLAPVCPTLPFKLGERAADPLAMYLSDALTVPMNLAGVPSLAIPAGFSQEGLPIGLQLVGPQWSEERLLNWGHQYQLQTNWHTRLPDIGGQD